MSEVIINTETTSPLAVRASNIAPGTYFMGRIGSDEEPRLYLRAQAGVFTSQRLGVVYRVSDPKARWSFQELEDANPGAPDVSPSVHDYQHVNLSICVTPVPKC